MNTIVRQVRQVIRPQSVLEGAGVRLKRSFPNRSLDFPDPFLLFDHFGSEDPDDYMAGFPMHPHRGIETVTYMLAGAVKHRDSMGNTGVIEAGDVQWMTAGGGIMHEEMPQLREGPMEGFQLWVNLPARLKMSRPRYQEVAAESIPATVRPDGTTVRVIAGEVAGVCGPVTEIAAEPTYFDVELPPGTVFTHPVPTGHTVLVYVYRGEIAFGNAAPVAAPSLVVLDDGDTVVLQTAAAPASVLLMSGKPAGEPIVRYGPFVMNTVAEIHQALDDLRRGTFVR